jgi:hypothetical protein
MGKVKEEENNNSLNKSVASKFDSSNASPLYGPNFGLRSTPLVQDIAKGGEAIGKAVDAGKKVASGIGAAISTVLEADKQKSLAMFNEIKEYGAGTPESLAEAQKRTAATGINFSDVGQALTTGEAVSPLPKAPYQPKASPLPVFSEKQNAAADEQYKKAFPVATSEEKVAAKNNPQGTPMPETSSVSNRASTEAAGIREAQRQEEFSEYQKTNPPQSYGATGSGAYENVDMGKGNITLYGEKPQPYKGLSAESQQLIKDMESEGLSPGRKAKVIQGIIASEKGEAGAMERAKLGMGMTEAQKEANILERDKMKQTLDLAEADRSMKEEDKVMQIALALSPTFKTKDLNDMEEKITETKDLSIYEAMLNDGSIKGKAAERLAKALEIVKGKQRKVLKPGDVVDGLRYKGGDSKKEGNWEKV